MRGSKNFCQRGSNFDNVFCCFLVDERRDDQNTTKSGPLSARQRNAIYMAFCWRPDDGLTLKSGLVALRFFRGSVPVLLRKPIFVIFLGGGGGSGPPVAYPSGSADASQEIFSHVRTYPGLNKY